LKVPSLDYRPEGRLGVPQSEKGKFAKSCSYALATWEFNTAGGGKQAVNRKKT